MSRGVNAQDGYLEALVKNMPSETVAAYLAIMGMFSGMESMPAWLQWLIWGVFLVATPFYLWLMRPSNESPGRPWWQIWIFSPAAFFIWSMTTTGPFSSIDKAPLAGSVLLVLFSVLIFPLLSMGIAKATAR